MPVAKALPDPSPREIPSAQEVAAVPVHPVDELTAVPARPVDEVAVVPARRVDDVTKAVEAWRQAWSARDMKNYLAAYSETFTPQGMSRKAWIANRHRNVGGRKSIEVQISNQEVQFQGDGRVRVSFLQDYVSDAVRETGQPKTLDLVMEDDGQWRIVAERQGPPPES